MHHARIAQLLPALVPALVPAQTLPSRPRPSFSSLCHPPSLPCMTHWLLRPYLKAAGGGGGGGMGGSPCSTAAHSPSHWQACHCRVVASLLLSRATRQQCTSLAALQQPQSQKSGHTTILCMILCCQVPSACTSGHLGEMLVRSGSCRYAACGLTPLMPAAVLWHLKMLQDTTRNIPVTDLCPPSCQLGLVGGYAVTCG